MHFNPTLGEIPRSEDALKRLLISKVSMKKFCFCLYVLNIFRTFVSVKQTVMDMADVLKSMYEKLGSMQKIIDLQYGTICTLSRNINKLIGCPVRCSENLKRSSCWPGGTEGQYEDRVVRQEDISMGINPALDYLSMPSSVEIKAGAATAN